MSNGTHNPFADLHPSLVDTAALHDVSQSILDLLTFMLIDIHLVSQLPRFDEEDNQAVRSAFADLLRRLPPPIAEQALNAWNVWATIHTLTCEHLKQSGAPSCSRTPSTTPSA